MRPKGVERLNEYVQLMNNKSRESVLKYVFSTKDWTYNALCMIIRCHPMLDNAKDILMQFQVCDRT